MFSVGQRACLNGRVGTVINLKDGSATCLFEDATTETVPVSLLTPPAGEAACGMVQAAVEAEARFDRF